MLECKTFELRDRNTFIPVVAVCCAIDSNVIAMTEADRYLLRRAGYGRGDDCILFTRLDAHNAKANYDPYAWGDRTFHVAHLHAYVHWHDLKSGDVLDVEYLLGETTEPKQSERSTATL